MTGATALQQLNVPVRFVASTRAHSCGGYSQVGMLGPEIPALLTRISMRPPLTALAAASTAPRSVTSTSAANAGPTDLSSEAVVFASAISRSHSHTVAPP